MCYTIDTLFVIVTFVSVSNLFSLVIKFSNKKTESKNKRTAVLPLVTGQGDSAGSQSINIYL